MLQRKRNISWGKSICKAEFSQVITKIYTKKVTLDKRRSKISFSFSEQLTLKSKQITLLMTRITRLDLANTMSIQIHLSQKKLEGLTPPALLLIERTYYLTAITIQVHKNIQIKQSLLMLKAGRPILVLLEQLKGNLLHFMLSNHLDQRFQVQEATHARVSFKRNMPSRKWKVKMLKSKVNLKAAFSLQLLQGHLILN